jgi:internalin A
VKKADLKHLAALAGVVRELEFRGAWSELSDLSPLKSWTRLEAIGLSNTGVSDLTPLAGKATIKSLSLAETPVTDLTPLTTLPALESLSIEKVKASLAPLARLTGLKYLHAGFTELEDLSLLSGMKSLQQLNLWGVKVRDLSPLASLPLTSLSLTYVQPVPDLMALVPIATLRSLDLVGCNADPESVLALKKKLPNLSVSA